jgi:general secretion pathway protein A
MYYDYWGLKKPPFDNVPDPTMYADSHTSMESAIAESLFAIEEGNECVAVIVGDVGLGKTLSLRIIIDSLEHEKYKIALVTNPDMSFIDLLREIIGQLVGKQCDERRKVNLLEIFNKLLFETIDEGKKVLIFIDEANAMSPANLESLRLLTNMQDDQRNLFTIVLAGQLELARRLEHPKRANLLQRIGTFSRIDKIGSEDLVRAYVQTRLRLAGGTRNVFTDDAYGFLWEYSEHGVPRLINKICKLSLKAGETNQFNQISGEVVRQIGERFRNLAGPAVQKRKPRKRPESKVIAEPVEEKPKEVLVEPSELSVDMFRDRRSHDEPPPLAVETEERPGAAEDVKAVVVSAEKIPPPAAPPVEEAKPAEPVAIEVQKPAPDMAAVGAPIETVRTVEEDVARPFAAAVEPPKPAEEVQAVPTEFIEEIEMAGYKVTINIPFHLIEQAQSATPEHRMKVAGALAAQILKKHSELTSSPSIDPISVWSDIRELVVARLK